MHPIRLTAKAGMSAALGLALLGLMAIANPARAGDDTAPDIKFLRGILSSLGLQSQDDAYINYQERPPLVIPSNDRLPPPQKTDAAVNNPAWPKDPDVARAKMLKQSRNTDISVDQFERDSRALRPDEMTPGRKYAPPMRQHRTVENPSISADGTVRLRPSELGVTGGLFKKMFGKGDDEEAVRFTGEPPRTALTEPPSGYQTPSPNQPYGKGRGYEKPKVENYYLTHGELR